MCRHYKMSYRPVFRPVNYLNYDKITKLQSPSVDGICVRCYYNLRFWVCPNPQNADKVKGIKESYNKGFFTEFKDINLSQEDFKNPENWDS